VFDETKGLSRPDCWNRLLSKDMRGRMVGAGLVAGESGWSRFVRGFENSDWRCWRVDLLSDEERFGTSARGLNSGLGAGPEEEGASFSFADSSVGSPALLCPPSSLSLSSSLVLSMLSNILKSESAPKLALWTLRLFADGLPRLTWSSPMMPSLRLRGLAVDENPPKISLRRFSTRDSVGFGPMMPSGGRIFSVDALAPAVSSGPRLLVSSAGTTAGVAITFSSPGASVTGGAGVAFPWSVNGFNARFVGLLGDVRVRVAGNGPVRRIVGRVIFALDGWGMANGDWFEEEPVETRNRFPWLALREGESGEEMNGVVFCAREGRRRKSELLDGERDNDRRSCLMAEPAST